MIKKMSKLCTNFIGNNLEKTNTDLEQIQYGIESILTNTLKTTILFTAAYFCGILQYTFIALISFGAIRMFASGIHASSSFKCNIMNFIIFFGNVLLSCSFQLNQFIITLLFIANLLLMILYSPADTKSRPLTNKRNRKKLKFFSIIMIIFLYILSMLLKDSIYASLITFSVTIESLLITPLTYKIFKSPYKNYEKFN
jgi:accessory gene regulator B